MPISADPSAVAEFSLRTDESKPAESRPAFLFRYMTRRERARVLAMIEEARSTDSDDRCYQLLTDAINLALVGWRNMTGADGRPLAFARENWDEPLTDSEIWEIANRFPLVVRLSEIDRKKFDSQSPPGGEASASSATDAAPVAADA